MRCRLTKGHLRSCRVTIPLEDVCPEICEQPGRDRSREYASQVEHLDSGQRCPGGWKKSGLAFGAAGRVERWARHANTVAHDNGPGLGCVRLGHPFAHRAN